MAELIIDRNYYNKLDIEGFSKMMSSPSYSYKFYWLEAIVQLISANRTEVTYDEIINKMIVNAWFPVQECIRPLSAAIRAAFSGQTGPY